VSRRHAVIRADGNGFTVTDAQSRDGTHVNNNEISGPTSINDGDRLRFGDTVLLATIETAPAEAPLAEVSVEPGATIQYDPRSAPPAVAPPVKQPDAKQPGVKPSVKPGSVTPSRLPGSGAVRITARPGTVRPAPIAPDGGATDESADAGAATPLPTPPPREAPAVAKQEPREAAVVVMHAPRLPEVVRSVDDLAAKIRQLEQDIASAVQRFEDAGGRTTLHAFLAHARKIQDGPRNGDDVETLLSWLPRACRLLETELALVNLLTAQASDAPR
jgi:predicted component of type VI protein secretion system